MNRLPPRKPHAFTPRLEVVGLSRERRLIRGNFPQKSRKLMNFSFAEELR